MKENAMKIEHVCINVADIEKEKDFYCQLFDFRPSAKYHNAKTGWENYFLSSPTGEARLELLSHEGMALKEKDRTMSGLVHLSFSLDSKEAVDEMTTTIVGMGLTLLRGPRVTGDGYYESSFLDPEGNMIELTI